MTDRQTEFWPDYLNYLISAKDTAREKYKKRRSKKDLLRWTTLLKAVNMEKIEYQVHCDGIRAETSDGLFRYIRGVIASSMKYKLLYQTTDHKKYLGKYEGCRAALSILIKTYEDKLHYKTF